MLDAQSINEAAIALKQAFQQKGYSIDLSGSMANSAVQLINGRLGEATVPTGNTVRDAITQVVRSAPFAEGGGVPATLESGEIAAQDEVIQRAISALMDVII
jgi:hypothetical protein